MLEVKGQVRRVRREEEEVRVSHTNQTLVTELLKAASRGQRGRYLQQDRERRGGEEEEQEERWRREILSWFS